MVEELKLNLKKLRAIIKDVIKQGKEAYGMRNFHCYDFEPIKKECSLSVLLKVVGLLRGYEGIKNYEFSLRNLSSI